MQALVYHGPGRKAWEEVPDPELIDEDDAIVRVDATTICGTDLRILAGDVPGVGRWILGHEASAPSTRSAPAVRSLPGDRVLMLLHQRLRHLPVLPRRMLRSVPGRRRLGVSAAASTAPRPSTSASPTRTSC